MRTLLLTQHYAPEITAGRFRLEAFVDRLCARGNDVEVICPVPNHPRGVVEPEFRGRVRVRRHVGGARVSYVWVATTRRKTPLTRLAYYGSFAAASGVAGAAVRRPDVVLASSPPLSVAASGALVAMRHRVPLLLDIRDLWPRSPVDVGELSEGPVVTALEQLERWLYARASAIVTANDAFAAFIAERAPASARILVAPNGTTADQLALGASEVTRAAVGLPERRFVWAYAGNIGLAHGLEHAADAARLLGEDYLLLVIGDGPRREALATHVGPASTLVDMRGLMPPHDAARHLRAADVLLVTERQEMTVSAKLYDACAIGRPLVAACQGELRRIVEREELGLAVPHGDPQALADAVRRLRADPGFGARLARRGREFAAAHLRERQADRVAELAESLAAS